MDVSRWRIGLSRLAALACVALGVIGLIVGFSDRVWQLGTVGWFTGGTLLGVVAVILLLDEYISHGHRDR